MNTESMINTNSDLDAQNDMHALAHVGPCEDAPCCGCCGQAADLQYEEPEPADD